MILPSLSYWLLFVSSYNYIGAAFLAYKPESLEYLFAGSATVLLNNNITVPILRRDVYIRFMVMYRHRYYFDSMIAALLTNHAVNHCERNI